MKAKIDYKSVKKVAYDALGTGEYSSKHKFLLYDDFLNLYNKRFCKDGVDIRYLIKWIWTLTPEFYDWHIQDLCYDFIAIALGSEEFDRYNGKDDHIGGRFYSRVRDQKRLTKILILKQLELN